MFRIIKNELKRHLHCDILEDKVSKEAHNIPVLEDFDADSGKGIPIIVEHTDEPTSIASESILLQSLIKPISIKRMYVPKECAEEARRIVREFLKKEESD